MRMQVLLLYSTFVTWIGYTDGQRKPRAETPEMRLLDFLFVKSGYTTDMRPVYDEVDVTNLTIAINQFSVLSVDPSEEIVSLSIEFLITWRDEFLIWDPDEFNITFMKVKETSVWVPDVVVSTSISRTLLLDQSERYVDLTNEGFVTMSMYGIFENICKMQVDEFPFDQQTALINIGPWSYRSQQISVTALQPINWERYKGNSEWDLLGFNATTIQTTDSDISFVYDEAVFTFTVKRRPQFYVWVLLIPTLIITIVSIFGLFIPTNTLGEREERVGYIVFENIEDTVLYHVYDTLPSSGVIEAVEELAKIHATSLKYHAEIKDFSGDYLPEILTDVTNEKNVRSAMLQLMEMLPECTEHLKKVLEKLHIFAFTNYVKAGLDVFKCRVLCHGDLWTPNVMWNKNGRLRSIIDFQLMHSGSPVEDFAMFVITSTSGETRRKDLPQFIERYHAAFEGRCKAMNIDLPFTKQQFADEYEKFVPFELVPLLPFFVPMLDSMVANAKDPVAAKTIFLDKLRGMVEDAGASIDEWYSDQ